jgi:hypothetical protein
MEKEKVEDADSDDEVDMFDVHDNVPVVAADDDDFEVKSNTFESPKNTSGGKDKPKTLAK